MDDFLLYIPENRINDFKETFEKVAKLELEVENESKCEGGHVISFLNIYIYRYPTKMEISKYRKPCASMRTVNFLSNILYRIKVNTLEQAVKNVLGRTSNSKLVKDLEDVHHMFRCNFYPFLTIKKVLVRAILKHITDLDNKEVNIPLTEIETKNRKAILMKYRSKEFDIKINKYIRKQSRRNKKAGDANRSRKTYSGDCIPFYKLIAIIHKRYDLPNPVFKTKRIKYSRVKGKTPQCLNKSKKEGNIESRKDRKIRIGLVKCGGCEEYFIIYGNAHVEILLESYSNDKKSDISRHCREKGHTIPQEAFDISNKARINVGAQIQIYNALMRTSGLSCHSTKTIVVIPRYIRMLITYLGKRGTQKLGLRGIERLKKEEVVD